MTQDIFFAKRKQMRGHVKEWWGKLTDDDLDRIDGALNRLAGALQARYGWEHGKIDREIWKDFEQSGQPRPAGH